MTMKRNLTRTLLVFGAALGALSGSSAAFAATPSQPAKAQVTQRGMYVAGFNAAVAKAHGYKIVTYANGDKQSVPSNASSHLPKGPMMLHRQAGMVAAQNSDYNQVQGNCGISYIVVGQTGTNQVQIVSGYKNLAGPAYFWSWDVQLNDRNGTSHQTYEGATQGTQASRTWRNLNQFGFTHDFVNNGGATLDDGTICLSGRPDVSINL